MMNTNKETSQCKWTNEYAIRRDLSLVQGRVPVAIEHVGARDKPPSLNITEETEEEYFKHGSADADVEAAPDLGLIKKMLNMVRDANVSTDEEDYFNKPVVISKLNPQSTEFVPKTINTSTPIDQSPKKLEKKENLEIKNKKENLPKKRQRNIAVESILQAIADSKENTDVEPMKLLKPDDFITENVYADATEDKPLIENQPVKTSTDNSQYKTLTELRNDVNVTRIDDVSATVTEKVTGWLKTQDCQRPFPKRMPKVVLEPTNVMFKRKNLTNKVKKVESIKSPSSSSSNGEYIPSTLANEYYKEYLERSRFKETVRNDIWTKAEKRMKEIEEKRRLESSEAVASPSGGLSSTNGSDISECVQSPEEDTASKAKRFADICRCLDIICMSQHRHSLIGECIVCEVLLKQLVKCESDNNS